MTLPSWLTGRTLTPVDLSAEGNAFTALRWLLASSVMFSHAWDLTQVKQHADPSVAVLGTPVSGLAVLLFFTLSGFLVTGSLAKRGVLEFALARALRLIPGLWVMLIVVTLGLGATLGSLPFGSYLTDPQTWRFVVHNAALVLSPEYNLPGVFTDLRSSAVNGSLWTIPQEVRCYIVLGLFGAAGALATRRWVLALLFVGILVQLLVPPDIVPLLRNPRRLGLSFLIGVAAYQSRHTLRWSWPLAFAGIAVTLGLVQAGAPRALVGVTMQIAFAYATGVAAFCAPAAAKRLSRQMPDFSYGIYIYAFPAQQVVISIGIGTTPMTNIASAFILMLPFAAASWYLIEHPALELKPRLLARRTAKLSENLTVADINYSSTIEKSTR